jgi:hypothetical protein
MVSSEATQAACIVDVYGLWPVQSGQLSRDVPKGVQWVQFLRSLLDDGNDLLKHVGVNLEMH